MVVINGVKSYMGQNDVGVPQGSIVGPLFFIVFINDVRKYVQGYCGSKGRLVRYADDTNFLLFC